MPISPGIVPLVPVSTNSTASTHIGTSLVSEGGVSPLLEAHPGSPVDISGRRPSLVQALASQQRLYSTSGLDVSRAERYPRSISSNKKEEVFKRDGVAAKGLGIHSIEGTGVYSKNLTIFIPPTVLDEDDKTPTSTTTTAMDLDFNDADSWATSPMALESHTSLATTTTAFSNMHTYPRGLTLDTSLASSSASMVSCGASIQSATTANSSDIYGWETELDRQTSTTESQFSTRTWDRERDLRRLPSGGRTHLGPKVNKCPGGVAGSAANGLSIRNTGSTGGSGRKEAVGRRSGMGTDGKRKSLLMRVLNLNGRGRVEENIPAVPVVPVMTGANGSLDVPMQMM